MEAVVANLTQNSGADTFQPLVVPVSEACRLLSISHTTAYKLISEGLLERVRIGRSTRISMASVKKLAAGGDR